MPPVKIDASRTNRSLAAAAAGPSVRPQLTVELPLLAWRRLIDTSLATAMKTKDGLPTYLAIMERWWLCEHRPPQSDKDEWERSLECACHFLDLDFQAERAKYTAKIDDVWSLAAVRHAADETYRRRARVLTCTGTPTRIGKQFVLGLVSLEDYEEIAGIEHADPPARKAGSKRPPRSRGRALPFPSPDAPAATQALAPGVLGRGLSRRRGRGSSPNIAACG